MTLPQSIALAYWFTAFAVMILIHTRNLSLDDVADVVPFWGIVIGGVLWLPIAIGVLVVAISEDVE